MSAQKEQREVGSVQVSKNVVAERRRMDVPEWEEEGVSVGKRTTSPRHGGPGAWE